MCIYNSISRASDLNRLNLDCILAQPYLFRPIFMCGSAAFQSENFALLPIVYELNYDHLRSAISACRPELSRAAFLFTSTLDQFRDYITLAFRHHTTLNANNFNIVVIQSESNIDFLQRQCAIDTYEDWDNKLTLPTVNQAFVNFGDIKTFNQPPLNIIPECITIGSSSASGSIYEIVPADSTTQYHEDVI